MLGFTKGIIVFAWLLVLNAAAYAQNFKAEGFPPAAGFVPDEQAAIRIAVAAWEPVYGKEAIANEKPFSATLKNGVWYVNGSLPSDTMGGTAFAAIREKDGAILDVSHSK